MSTKELAYSLLDDLNDEQLDAIILLIKSFKSKPVETYLQSGTPLLKK